MPETNRPKEAPTQSNHKTKCHNLSSMQWPHSHPICSSNPKVKQNDKCHIISNVVSFTMAHCNSAYKRHRENYLCSFFLENTEFLFNEKVTISLFDTIY